MFLYVVHSGQPVFEVSGGSGSDYYVAFELQGMPPFFDVVLGLGLFPLLVSASEHPTQRVL